MCGTVKEEVTEGWEVFVYRATWFVLFPYQDEQSKDGGSRSTHESKDKYGIILFESQDAKGIVHLVNQSTDGKVP